MEKNYQKLSIEAHRKARGKIAVISKFPVRNREDLAIAYTPGVAGPALEIAKNKKLAYDLTSTKNGVAIVSDGSAVLGLGNIGPEAALPIMEGKAVLFKRFANIDAFPIVLSTQNTDEIVATVKAIAPTFGGINLEDISAPRCFEIETRLKKNLPIPVMHDDQHGTAIVVLAGLINALKVVRKKKELVRVVINGAGAAGTAIAKLLYLYGVRHIVVCDSQGIVSKKRHDLTSVKKEILKITNGNNLSGSLFEALKDADVFIGVSKGNLLKVSDVGTMAKRAIIFAMANPVPEIMPSEAKRGGAAVVASGRSDFPNQINNVLAFPGIFKGAIESRITQITDNMKIAAALALASVVKKPTAKRIIPDPFDKKVVLAVSSAVKKLAKQRK
ncbi:MAG: malate dehydrogenase [Candidatus Zambryskibacteria bacterium RIFCSPHIGHO2_02_FULL_43_14]|uniref:Malate dehydrogenase n=1 Tax=Candidatus Zambryskibacteria bacterium RIFCSPHIGHO2_02_FULL_43_14 TaxID=1802748 RepID=A0A1G2TE64_9BACT|nr:MAG: malate dehydrogenase [Candidatus Zambryskibacteria bacterium RIFCSPHIGHO2_01_FULL_43_60]OHA95543.1 MAG: malate dehydrogenase [Candidatus Zambryskibacteria bacterium RIFCSPHIGHO2_02_FULL_43_14]OHB02897.1 MAG: malate dehydrogenase [Candidatus Zambryskibacteria bacterium RIFCSPLOWO2_01_FULL_42_41]